MTSKVELAWLLNEMPEVCRVSLGRGVDWSVCGKVAVSDETVVLLLINHWRV